MIGGKIFDDKDLEFLHDHTMRLKLHKGEDLFAAVSRRKENQIQREKLWQLCNSLFSQVWTQKANIKNYSNFTPSLHHQTTSLSPIQRSFSTAMDMLWWPF